jgi:predicted transcriptional regulator
MTIRLEGELKKRLERLSDATRRSKSFIAAEAIRDYVELNEWQIQEIQSAIKEADAEEFASDTEIQKFVRKWSRDAG